MSVEHLYGFLFQQEKKSIKNIPHAHDVIDMLFALTHLKINAASSSWWHYTVLFTHQLERCTKCHIVFGGVSDRYGWI